MPYKPSERQRIYLKAQRKLGLRKKQDGEDRADFVDQCVADLVDSGEYEDEDEARDVCEMIWDETGGD